MGSGVALCLSAACGDLVDHRLDGGAREGLTWAGRVAQRSRAALIRLRDAVRSGAQAVDRHARVGVGLAGGPAVAVGVRAGRDV